jgi:hypothetical protein
MNANELDTRINNFLQRKYISHPELVASGRSRSRTTKYAMKLRASGQILLARVY